MAFLSSLLCSSARLLSTSRWTFRELAKARLTLSAHRRYTDNANSSVDPLSSTGLECYKDLQKYFKRRLGATYRRFSNIPDHSLVYGHHHVYFVDSYGIYRMDKRQSESDPEQVLDLEEVCAQEETGLDKEEGRQRIRWTVQRIRLSPQEKHLAATLRTDHTEELRCVVVKLGSRSPPSTVPPHVIFTLDKVFSFEWATDTVLFYTTAEGLRCSTVHRLDLTPSESRITLVYKETHPHVFVEVALSRDGQILSINCNSRTSSEVMLVDGRTSPSEPSVVQPRQPGLLYHVEHWRGRLIILANTGPGQEYQVVQAPLSEPTMASWVPLFAPDPGTVVKDMDVVGDHCVLVARTPIGELVLIVVPLCQPKKAYTVQLPTWACAIETKKADIGDQHGALEFLISSPVHPPVSYSLNPEDRLLLTRTENQSSPENQGDYSTMRLEACSQDDTLVPVTLFHKVHLEGLRRAPLLVHVYGAYGRDLNMEFCPEKRFLLEQGWALAYCHIRGGGERGLSWQRQAGVEGKQRGVEDLRACLQHLFASGVSSPSLTALTAFSAGAVPVGALCNTHPHMMRAVILQAPFLDVLGTMEDPSLPLTVEDREEWGDPVENPNHRLTISSYCPLHNITPQCYPSILLTAYRDDARVPLAGVLNYTNKLKKAINTHIARTPKSECEPTPNIVLNVQPGANHLGPEDFDMMLEEEANRMAFLYTELSLDPPRTRRKRNR